MHAQLRNLVGGNEGNHEKSKDGWPMAHPGFELAIPEYKVYSAAATPPFGPTRLRLNGHLLHGHYTP
jgi:hypothetical protein